MSTQKNKFALFARLGALGFTYDEAVTLRRIEMTLNRWAGQECGDSNDRASWSIERDETSGKPFRCVHYHNRDKADRYPIADREAGALRRLRVILARHPGFAFYQQTDPRGCALYLIRPGDVPEGASVDSCYTNGLAICA